MMNNLISKLSSALAGYDFFHPKYLCERQAAVSRFHRSLNEARSYYAARGQIKIAPELIHDSWQQNISALESYFVNVMDVNFMSNEVINGTMVFTNRDAHELELRNLSAILGKKVTAGIISKNLNAAFLSGKSRRSTLINSAHHLYHLVQFEQKTGRRISSFKNIVEFGGGYGNMARIIGNMAPYKSYSIIDLLLFSCIQYVFLNTVFENKQVDFYDENVDSGTNVILYPLFRTDLATSLQGELFLSTWALSESTRAAYEWVVDCNWFGATSLLLAYNKHWKPWHENELEDVLRSSGWSVTKEPISFLPDSFYIFATR